MNLTKFHQAKRTDFFKKENGFSFIEMLLVVIIIAIIAAVITVIYITSTKSQNELLTRFGSESRLRTALYSIAKDIRNADSINKAGSDYIEFISGTSTINYGLILSGDNSTYILNKTVSSGGSTVNTVIMKYINGNNVFSYFLTSSGVPLAVPLSSSDLLIFKLVNLNFIINSEPSKPAGSVNLSTTVSLRGRE
jgi:prepilin-type N-terminal cleavage/methylation domain-containing protein